MFDEIGYWSELKLEIIQKYAQAYSKILDKKNLYHIYIDAFSSSGINISRNSGDLVLGSSLNAINIDPPFKEYHLIDLDNDKIQILHEITKKEDNVKIYEGDANEILIKKILPTVRYEQYKRAFCLLDPYGLHFKWDILRMSAELKTVDIFINFPIMAMNRTVLWDRFERVHQNQVKKMNEFWGDSTWERIVYRSQRNLFGGEEKVKIADSQTLLRYYMERLKTVAGFKFVPDPLPMRNKVGSILYYLLFASQQLVAENIIRDIFDKYREKV